MLGALSRAAVVASQRSSKARSLGSTHAVLNKSGQSWSRKGEEDLREGVLEGGAQAVGGVDRACAIICAGKVSREALGATCACHSTFAAGSCWACM